MKEKCMRVLLLMLLVTMFSVEGVYAAVITVKGTVASAADAIPLVGCSVVVKGTNTGVVSDRNGNYSVQVEKGKTLVFSYIGFVTKEVKANKTMINVALEEECMQLDEEVVTGYSEVNKRMFTGAVACYGMRMPMPDAEEYNHVSENRFLSAKETPLSTFSVDVDAASYSNMRRFINQGQLPPKDAIRTEELVNYFSYDYAKPTGVDPVRITTEVGVCPWNEKHRLVRIGLKAKEIPTANLPESNLVFLIDVSGSMFGPTRLDLVKSSLKLLVNNLREKDKVAIVVYAGSAGEKLPSTSGSDKQKIREALDELQAGGSTAGFVWLIRLRVRILSKVAIIVLFCVRTVILM